MAKRYSSLSGVKYHHLTVRGEADRKPGNNNRRVRAECVCGSVRDYFLHALRSGNSKSCGCIPLSRFQNESHGHTLNGRVSREYQSWACMKSRCAVGEHGSMPHYGARGITVCAEWNRFERFLADMGPRPDGHTLDRIDPNGNYDPSNCRWASIKTQANNKRSNTFIEHDGLRLTISQWAERYGLAYNTLIARINRLKWPIEKALLTPPKKF